MRIQNLSVQSIIGATANLGQFIEFLMLNYSSCAFADLPIDFGLTSAGNRRPTFL